MLARLVPLLAVAAACGGESRDDANVARGRGLRPAALDPAAEAAAIEAAARATFDFGPDLTLRLHPQRLPRTAGWTGGDSVPAGLVRALVGRGVVAGLCTPQRDAPRNTPRCAGGSVGYIVRPSDLLRVAADTVELYFAAERYGAEKGQRPEALRMEKIYQLVGAGSSWRVVREARAKTE